MSDLFKFQSTYISLYCSSFHLSLPFSSLFRFHSVLMFIVFLSVFIYFFLPYFLFMFFFRLCSWSLIISSLFPSSTKPLHPSYFEGRHVGRHTHTQTDIQGRQIYKAGRHAERRRQRPIGRQRETKTGRETDIQTGSREKNRRIRDMCTDKLSSRQNTETD